MTQTMSSRFMWDGAGITIESGKWGVTYTDENAAQVLVRDGEEMILHCQQEAAANQSIQEYLEAFMKTSQAKNMPKQVRDDLEELGVI